MLLFKNLDSGDSSFSLEVAASLYLMLSILQQNQLRGSKNPAASLFLAAASSYARSAPEPSSTLLVKGEQSPLIGLCPGLLLVKDRSVSTP